MTHIFSNKSLKYARIEEERRFLLSEMPADLDPDEPFVRILDRYIAGTRLRLRRIESPEGEVLVYKLGQKYSLPDGEPHQTIMTNIYLDVTEFEVFFRLPHSTLIKQRFSYHYRDLDFSIDRFEGHLEGLFLAEIENHGIIDIVNLPVPDFAIRDVTDDQFFIGSHLAGISEGEFQDWLAFQ